MTLISSYPNNFFMTNENPIGQTRKKASWVRPEFLTRSKVRIPKLKNLSEYAINYKAGASMREGAYSWISSFPGGTRFHPTNRNSPHSAVCLLPHYLGITNYSGAASACLTHSQFYRPRSPLLRSHEIDAIQSAFTCAASSDPAWSPSCSLISLMFILLFIIYILVHSLTVISQ